MLGIGILVGLAEIQADILWSDWEAGVFTPVALQVIFLAVGINSIFFADWDDIATMLPIGILLFTASCLMAVAPLLVPDDKRRMWAKLMLILLLLCSAIGWWTNWNHLQ